MGTVHGGEVSGCDAPPRLRRLRTIALFALALAGTSSACAEPAAVGDAGTSRADPASENLPEYVVTAEPGLEGVARSILSDPSATARTSAGSTPSPLMRSQTRPAMTVGE
jgi:hypothetical protein